MGWFRGGAAGDGYPTPVAYRRAIAAIAAEGPPLAALPLAALRARFDDLRTQAVAGTPLDALLAPCFALVREAIRRLLGLRLRDAQLVAGVVLHEGKIAELATGAMMPPPTAAGDRAVDDVGAVGVGAGHRPPALGWGVA